MNIILSEGIILFGAVILVAAIVLGLRRIRNEKEEPADSTTEVFPLGVLGILIIILGGHTFFYTRFQS